MTYRTFDGGGRRARKGEGTEGEEDVKGYTMNEALDHIGLGPAHIKIGMIAGVSWVADGAEMMILSILGPILLCEWRLTPVYEALLTTVAFFGFMLGSAAFGYFADSYGRKTGLICSGIWMLYYGVLCAAAPDLIWMYILRCALGFGVGGCPVVMTYCSEFFPSKWRGKLLLSVLFFWTLGSSLQVVLAMLLVHHSWRYWLLASNLPVLLFIIVMKYLPLSPRHLLSSGRVSEALDALSHFADSNNKSLPPGILLTPDRPPSNSYKHLFTPAFRRSSILLAILWFLAAFGYYGLVLFSTELIKVGHTCSSGSIISGLPSRSCSLACEPFTTSQYTDILVTSVAELPGILVAMILVDLVGRKNMFIIFFSVFAVTCGLLTICMTRLPMLILLFLSRTCVTSAFQGLYIYTSELYPTECRSSTVGLGSMCSKLGAIFTPYVAQVLLTGSSLAGLGVYCAVGIISTIATVLLPIETKGRQMTEHY